MADQVARVSHNHSYSMSADLEIRSAGAKGVIVAEADHVGGFAGELAEPELVPLLATRQVSSPRSTLARS